MLNEVDLTRADLNLLILFEAVYGERHIGRAAVKLHVSPSAISHGLGRLRRLLNDPLFLKTPRGVVPTQRATELADSVGDILARIRTVVATAEPFDPAKSERRFTLGAPDGVAAVLLPTLLEQIERDAPKVDIGVRQLLPIRGETSPELAWRETFAALESRAIDIAIIPSEAIPQRFEYRCVYEETFVIATRSRHPFLRNPTLERYCRSRHLVVSADGDPHGFVDEQLSKQKLSRRVALTVPNFMFALAVVADTDLIAALPRQFVAAHGARFGIKAVDAPFRMPSFRLNAVVPKVALMDAAVAWLFGKLSTRDRE